ncbi:reverse transcriptase domain-containing protein [Tanacetum coccineum]
MIRAVRINVPLVDVLARMPNYGKFLKELVNNKHKIEQISIAFLSDESSAILQNKVPLNLRDPGTFLIPYNFNKAFSCNALANLGASINLMPYSLYAKLSLKTLKPTKTSTFFHTAGAIIRVLKKQLNLGVGTKRMTFHIDSAMKHYYSNDDTCFSIDVINEILEKDFDTLLDEGSKIPYSIEGTILKEKLFAEFDELMSMTIDENSKSESDTEEPPFEKSLVTPITKSKHLLKNLLRILRSNLFLITWNIFLEEPSFLPAIISSQLSEQNKNKVVSVLKSHKQAFAWKTTNIPGIFDIKIKDKKGTKNVAADHLSRIENDETSNDNEVDDNFPGETLMEIDTRDEPWFTDFANYLVSDIIPKEMTYQQKNKFFYDLKHYFWEEPYLVKVCSEGMIRRCVSGPETRTMLDQCHHGPTSGHYGLNTTTKKVLDSGFYWSTIIKEAHTQVRLCKACQKTRNISKRDEMPLNSIQWAEAQAQPTNDARVVISFQLFCRFEMPKALISNRGTHYCNKIMEKTMKRYRVNHRFSTSYHPQTSGQVENTNKALKRILEKPVKDDFAIWSRKLDDAKDPQCSTRIHSSINAVIICPKQPNESQNNKPEEEEREEKNNPKNINTNPSLPPDPSVSFVTEKVRQRNSFLKSLGLVPPSSNTKIFCAKGDDSDVMFIEIIKKNDDSRKEEPEVGENTGAGELEVEYFNIFLTRSELAYYKYLMSGPIPSIFLKSPIITEGCPSNLKIPCNIRHVHVEKAYIDLNSPLNVMTQTLYNWNMRRKLDPRGDPNRRVSNFSGRIKEIHVFVGNFTYVIDFMIVEDISSIIDPRMSQVVLGKPIVEISNMTHDPPEGVVRFTNETGEIAYKMPHKIIQYNSLSDLEREHTKLVYLRNEEDKKRGAKYMMSNILGFYK